MEIIPKRRKLAEVFKKAFPGINRGPVAPHKGLSLPLKIAVSTAGTAFVSSTCLIADLIANRNIKLSTQELQQATSLATEFTSSLSQDAKPQLDQAGFVEPTFQVGVVKQDGQLNIQRYFAGDNILFMVPVTDVNGKSGIILRNLSAPFDPLMSLNSARAVDLVTLYQSQNGADLIGISEEGEIVYKAVNAWVDGHINENATIEVMTVDSTGIKDGGFAQLKIENPNSPSVVISAQINPDNPNEVLGQVDQENKRLSKVIPPTPEGLPISLISLSINPVTPTPKPTETPIPTATPTETPKPTATATPTPTEVPLPSEFLTLAEEHGFSYKVVDGKVMVDLVDGSSVEINPAQVADWPMWEDNYLVIKGNNGIPQLRYVEGKGWESVEQTSMIDAFGNTVPGWVVETSAVWDGEPPVVKDNRLVEDAEYLSPQSGTCVVGVSVNMKQWQLLEFMASDGTKMQSLQIDVVFNNGKQIITVRSRTFDLDNIYSSNPRGLMNSFTPGQQIYISYWWGDLSSSITPQDLAKFIFEFRNGGSSTPKWKPEWIKNNPCITEIGCAMETGQFTAKKFPRNYMRQILIYGSFGDFVDLSQDTLISNWKK